MYMYYRLTWMFFQQLKKSFDDMLHRVPNTQENFVMGAIAAAGSVVVMIPMDTVKTRLVIQVIYLHCYYYFCYNR